MKITNKIPLILFVIFSIKFFVGCGGTEEITEDTSAKDSTIIYQALENTRSHYSKALDFNEQSDSKSSAEEFEMAVNQLYKIDRSKLEKHMLWNSDFNELTKSVVQDYLTTANDISADSKVFKLAKKLNIAYEKNESKTFSADFDPDNLPKGDGIKLTKNSYVDEYINYFQHNGKKYMDKWLYRQGKYSNLIRSILKENDAPEELVYLSMIESGLDPGIHSWAGAIGLWQFMPTTGSSYGLYYDQYTDDKCDPEKSTDAAARHLKDLYKSFGDWYLALASYDAGPGRINSAIQKAGSSDFWAIRDYLPKETRNYVPQFIACAMISIDPKAYGFNDVEYAKPLEYDRVIIKAQLSISRIAELCNTQTETIRDLNPQILKDITPVFEDGYLIKIPKGSFNEFAKNYEDATDFDKNNFKPISEGNEGYAMNTTSSSTSYKVIDYNVDDVHLIISKSNRNLVFHRFSEKDNLNSAAIKYDVRPSDIRIWNNYPYGKYPRKGDSLSVWVTNAKYKELFGMNSKNEETKQVTSIVKTDTLLKSDTNSIKKTQDNISNYHDSSNVNQTDKKELSDHKEKNNSSVLVNKEHKGETNESITQNETKTDPVEPKEKVINEKKESSTKKERSKGDVEKKSSVQSYSVKSGDNLSMIADKYDVDVSDIKDWNNLNDDKIFAGQKLKIYSDKKTSSDNSELKSKKKSKYVVKSGDNLTSIADEFGVSVADIKDWNDLDNDVIYEGQTLQLYSEKKTSSSTENKKVKTYKVKTGDNLTEIADKFGLTVKQIKDWNDLDGDVIYEGQLLKLYNNTKTTSKQKETTKTHIVKKGETLARIAEKYDVTIAEIKKWNKLKSDDIMIGQKLVIKD